MEGTGVLPVFFNCPLFDWQAPARRKVNNMMKYVNLFSNYGWYKIITQVFQAILRPERYEITTIFAKLHH